MSSFHQYAIMLLGAVNTFLRYLLHTFDLQSEDPWENKAIYLRYVDIVIGRVSAHTHTHTFLVYTFMYNRHMVYLIGHP